MGADLQVANHTRVDLKVETNIRHFQSDINSKGETEETRNNNFKTNYCIHKRTVQNKQDWSNKNGPVYNLQTEEKNQTKS